jgi:hypothetical protein
MAEPFGIAAGAIGIAAAFTTCVDVFEYIHLGRRFGKDFQTSQLKLTVLRLRLSRWGEAVRIYDDHQLGNPAASEAEIQAAKDTLLQILVLMDDSNKISKKFAINGNAGAISREEMATDAALIAVNNSMRQLAIKRQKGASLVKLAGWAIHHGAALQTLIDNISGLVGDLETLIPAPEAEKKLAKQEVDVLEDEDQVRALASASEGVDSTLHDATIELSGHKFTNIDIQGEKDVAILNGNAFAADYTGELGKGAAHMFDGVKIKGTDGLRVLNGDKHGGIDPFAR